MAVLAQHAHCTLHQVKDAIALWYPRWHKIGRAFTQLTWLGAYPQVFEEGQPHPDVYKAHDNGSGSGDSGSDDDGSGSSDNDSDDVGGDDAPARKRPKIEPLLDVKFVSLDGKVFNLDKFRRSHTAARCCYSDKTKTSGLQTLVWSLPCGIPILVTGLFGAKLSEKHQVGLHSGWLVAIPPGVSILEDRGFRKLQRHYPK